MKLNEMDNSWPEYPSRSNHKTREPLTFHIDDVTDIEVDGVDSSDYPDFVDAYASYAVWKDNGEELTDDELDDLTDQHRDVIHELAHESFH